MSRVSRQSVSYFEALFFFTSLVASFYVAEGSCKVLPAEENGSWVNEFFQYGIVRFFCIVSDHVGLLVKEM